MHKHLDFISLLSNYKCCKIHLQNGREQQQQNRWPIEYCIKRNETQMTVNVHQHEMLLGF